MRLNEYFPFGSFGNESEDRSELVRLALKRGRNFGWNGNLNSTYVIGDTPTDIESGKFAGTKTVAITTGSYSFEDLKKANPDYLINDLSRILTI